MKVVASSDMRIYGCNDCCKRWFITFDGQECSTVAIDGIVFMEFGAGTRHKNLHRPRVIRGHCRIDKQGAVNVALNVGKCKHRPKNVDAYTGWESSTRIYIEEVVAPQ